MTYDPRQWSFIADMNYSGSITISDLWLWFKWLYFYPGDGFFYIVIHKLPELAAFFEITFDYYGGTFSGFISFVGWLLIVGTIGGIVELVNE